MLYGAVLTGYVVAETISGIPGDDPIAFIVQALGILSFSAGAVAYHKLGRARYFLGTSALFVAATSSLGTLVAAAAFIAIGYQWRDERPQEPPQ